MPLFFHCLLQKESFSGYQKQHLQPASSGPASRNIPLPPTAYSLRLFSGHIRCLGRQTGQQTAHCCVQAQGLNLRLGYIQTDHDLMKHGGSVNIVSRRCHSRKAGLNARSCPVQLHAEVRGLISTIDQLLLTLRFSQVSFAAFFTAHLAP